MEKYTLKLTKEEREYLLSLIKTGKGAAYELTHARILLASDEGRYGNHSVSTDDKIASSLHVAGSLCKYSSAILTRS